MTCSSPSRSPGLVSCCRAAPIWATGAYDQAIALASDAKGEDAYGYRAEAVRLMRLAQSLSRTKTQQMQKRPGISRAFSSVIMDI